MGAWRHWQDQIETDALGHLNPVRLDFADESNRKSSPTARASLIPQPREHLAQFVEVIGSLPMTRSLNLKTSTSGSRSAFDNASIQIRET